MAPEKKLRMADLHVGDFWLMEDPVRLVRVEGVESIEHGVKGSDVVHIVHVLRVRATVPGFEIRGFVDVMRAKVNRRLNAAIAKSCEASGFYPPDTEWTEIWSERMIYPVTTGQFGTRVNDGAPKVAQFYCMRTEGRYESRDQAHRHPASRGQLAGAKVDGSLMPAKVFRDDPEPEQLTYTGPGPGWPAADDVELEVEAPRRQAKRQPKMTIGRAHKLAREANVDVSDISGTGAMERILERIRHAVQVQQTEGVDVQEQAGDGEAVAEENRQAEPARPE